MKLLTLNTHSLIEPQYEQKLWEFVEVITRELPDIIALQEVNQTCTAPFVSEENLTGFHSCQGNSVQIRQDNHAYQVIRLLAQKGVFYNWTWIGMKLGYGIYDEGMAILSKSPILETNTLQISNAGEYQNWKTRKILGICTEAYPKQWFFSTHMGWWSDIDEPFQQQWKRTSEHMKQYDTVWLLGDFNSPAQVREEGYDQIKQAGWFDSYELATEKDNGITVGTVIDGWKDKITSTEGMRMDQIWCNQRQNIVSSYVIFNGKREAIVSDHYGVIVEVISE